MEEHLGVLGRHVNNAYNTMSTVSGSFSLLGQKLAQTQQLGGTKDEVKQLEE